MYICATLQSYTIDLLDATSSLVCFPSTAFRDFEGDWAWVYDSDCLYEAFTCRIPISELFNITEATRLDQPVIRIDPKQHVFGRTYAYWPKVLTWRSLTNMWSNLSMYPRSQRDPVPESDSCVIYWAQSG